MAVMMPHYLDCSQGILIQRQYSKTSDLIIHIEKKEKRRVCVVGGRLWAYKTILKELNFDLLSTQNVIILAFVKRNLHKTHS